MDMGGLIISVVMGHDTFRSGKLIGTVKCRFPIPLFNGAGTSNFPIHYCHLRDTKIAILATGD